MNEYQRELLVRLFFRYGTNAFPVSDFSNVRWSLFPSWGDIDENGINIFVLEDRDELITTTKNGEVWLTDKTINLIKESANDE